MNYFVVIFSCNLSNPSTAKINSVKFIINDLMEKKKKIAKFAVFGPINSKNLFRENSTLKIKRF